MPGDRFGDAELIAKNFDGAIYTDGDDQYICEARPGSALSASVWRIRKKSNPSAGLQRMQFAQGSDLFKFAATDLDTVKALFA
jgi:hypothetical protein